MPLFGPPNIERLKEKGDVKALIKALVHRDYFVSRGAEAVLARMGAPAVEPLIDALKDNQPKVRGYSARLLGEIGDARAAGPLIAGLNDGDAHVRIAAAVALGKIGHARAVEPLIAALKDAVPFVRGAAAEALERISRPEAERALAEYRARQT